MFGRVDGQSDLSRLHSSLIERHKTAADYSQKTSTENTIEMDDTPSTTKLSYDHASGSIKSNLEMELQKHNNEESVLV